MSMKPLNYLYASHLQAMADGYTMHWIVFVRHFDGLEYSNLNNIEDDGASELTLSWNDIDIGHHN